MFIFVIDYWSSSEVFDTGSRKRAISKEYKTHDKARNAMLKALAASDTLNELGITDISASGNVTEVAA